MFLRVTRALGFQWACGSKANLLPECTLNEPSINQGAGDRVVHLRLRICWSQDYLPLASLARFPSVVLAFLNRTRMSLLVGAI